MPQTSSFKTFREFLEGTFPRPYGALRSRWYRHVLLQMANRIVAEHGLVVQNGSFQGMRYIAEMLSPQEVAHRDLVPKLLGSYEAELHPALEGVLGRNNETIVNIGCSEGYYAVGLSLRLPAARIFAFDLDPEARWLCEQMARLNGVSDRVNIRGECSLDALRDLASDRTLIVCDCEGCELALLQPHSASGLTGCDLIVELHDCIRPGTSQAIIDRFDATHDVEVIRPREMDASAYPLAGKFTPYEQRLGLREVRWGAPPVWGLFVSKQRGKR